MIVTEKTTKVQIVKINMSFNKIKSSIGNIK